MKIRIKLLAILFIVIIGTIIYSLLLFIMYFIILPIGVFCNSKIFYQLNNWYLNQIPEIPNIPKP